MNKQKEVKNRVNCPDISNDHTKRFLSKMQALTKPEIKTTSLGFGKLPSQKINKELISRFDQDLMIAPHYKEANVSNLEILEAFNYLSCWGDGFIQFEQMTLAVCIQNDTVIQDEYRDLAVGSSSASYGLQSGYMCVTVDNGLGCAQALIHEMAHQKLRLMGIDEKSQVSPICLDSEVKTMRSILNSQTRSLVNKAFHDLYAYMHVLELDLNIYQSELYNGVKEQVEQLLSKNAIRVSKGVFELLPKLECAPEWKSFMNDISSWGFCIVEEAIEVLKTTPYRMYNLERILNQYNKIC